MKIAIPNGGPQDGVRLFEGQTTPFPEGAIFPVENYESLIQVPELYRVVDGTSVREMTDDEKKIVDNERLDELKDDKNLAIDTRTQELIEAGLEYPEGSGNIFSMSIRAQKNWMALKNLLNEGFTAPPIETTVSKDGMDDEYVFETADDYTNFYLAGVSLVQTLITSGRALKVQVKNAADIDELNAVVDER